MFPATRIKNLEQAAAQRRSTPNVIAADVVRASDLMTAANVDGPAGDAAAAELKQLVRRVRGLTKLRHPIGLLCKLYR